MTRTPRCRLYVYFCEHERRVWFYPMSISSYYYEVLGVKSTAGAEEIKRAYRGLVRRNHPDLFPETQKELQELKMIQINEAYARVTEKLSHAFIHEKVEDEAVQQEGEAGAWTMDESIRNAIGFHRDVQYAYYKQGFNNFSKAVNGIKTIERNVRLKNDLYYLRRFARSLYYLRKADMYFNTLLEEYPKSIWAYDASIKLKRIEFFNRFYRKILLNIERKFNGGKIA